MSCVSREFYLNMLWRDRRRFSHCGKDGKGSLVLCAGGIEIRSFGVPGGDFEAHLGRPHRHAAQGSVGLDDARDIIMF